MAEIVDLKLRQQTRPMGQELVPVLPSSKPAVIPVQVEERAVKRTAEFRPTVCLVLREFEPTSVHLEATGITWEVNGEFNSLRVVQCKDPSGKTVVITLQVGHVDDVILTRSRGKEDGDGRIRRSVELLTTVNVLGGTVNRLMFKKCSRLWTTKVSYNTDEDTANLEALEHESSQWLWEVVFMNWPTLRDAKQYFEWR